MKFIRGIFISIGAIAITALGIDAADTFNGSSGTLLSQVMQGTGGVCPSGMVEVANISGLRCIDIYEASTDEGCPERDPQQMVATQKNIDTSACTASAKAGVVPWRYITRDQALVMCARTGKRLPTSEEWYALNLGSALSKDDCNVSSKNVAVSGSFSSCVAPTGAYDLVGNVWEWVKDDVIAGMYNARPLPSSGYVAQVDSSGVATNVASSSDALFGHDYFWSRADGAYGIIRGGYYDSGEDAGIYSVHADTLPTTASVGIGFRCVL